MMVKNFLQKVVLYYRVHPKRFWATGIVLIIAIVLWATRGPSEMITVIPVEHKDLMQTVRSTGQVVSQVDLSLSFSASDTIDTLPAVVGEKVAKGAILATLDNRDEYAQLSEARASLKAAQARYQKVIDGSSSEEVAVAMAALASAQSNLASTQRTQDTLVANAHQQLLNADVTPVLYLGSSGVAPTITGTYAGGEGMYEITTDFASGSPSFSYRGVEHGSGELSTTKPIPLGTFGLFIQFPTSYSAHASNVWRVLLPNKTSASYLQYSNAYAQALDTRDTTVAAATSTVREREADLALKKAVARPADVAVVEADVASAQAAVDAATTTYEKTILRAPVSGTITRVSAKIGERIDAQREIIVLEDVSDLYVESNINETNIAKVALGQQVAMTLDAFGSSIIFTGAVMHIDPSATVTDGIVNYKIKSSISAPVCHDVADCATLENLARPGMNANMTITAGGHPNVLVIPKAAVQVDAAGQQTVFVLTDSKKQTYISRPIKIGFEGDGNLVEVVDGLAADDVVVLVAKK